MEQKRRESDNHNKKYDELQSERDIWKTKYNECEKSLKIQHDELSNEIDEHRKMQNSIESLKSEHEDLIKKHEDLIKKHQILEQNYSDEAFHRKLLIQGVTEMRNDLITSRNTDQ